jgi:endonuclease G
VLRLGTIVLVAIAIFGRFRRELVSLTPVRSAAGADVSARHVSAPPAPLAREPALRPDSPHVPNPMAARVASSENVALGIPTDGDPTDDYLIDQQVYVVSYNPTRRAPNWVSWQLSREQLGHVRRNNDFRPDVKLPEVFYRVTSRDYANSGYDRGHLCPSADRARSPQDNALTFLMTNMLPQLHELNAGPWERLEEHERALARRRGVVLHIVAGALFGESASTIGHGVNVPRATYKIIVALEQGRGARDVTSDASVIAVKMPNEPGVGQRVWTDFVTSVDEIERETGYDFLPDVPLPVQEIIEAKVAQVP